MCGIAGAITWAGGHAALDTYDIARLAYRGPDARCTERSDELPDPPKAFRWSLSHARLSILDLASSANQPMSSADGRYWLVFNGEIYNHKELRRELLAQGLRFRTDHSDSEVLLNACIAWGKGALERLNGMFAFVFLDNRTGVAWGARDRLGIKPFYYRMADGTFTFASEPKAILGKRTVRRDVLLQYFHYMQVEGADTFFEGISKLPAAHWFNLDGHGKMSVERYWHPLQAGTKRDLLDASSCMELLQEAVDLQMEADVEVGTYLSGGLDSSVITALASRGGRQVNAFSIGFDDSVPGYASELPYAKQVAKHLHARHFPITISPAEYLAAQERAFKVLDEPIADTACGPLLLLSELARAHGVTVCLSGEGSDELFIGYRHWHDAYRVHRWLGRLPKAAVKALLALGAPGIATRKPEWVRWAARSVQGRFILWGGIDAQAAADTSVFKADFLASVPDPYSVLSRNLGLPAMQGADFLQQLSAFDLQFRLPENLLARVDRMSMAASLEARVPYLDHRLVEKAMHIPVPKLVSAQGEKLVLKEFARKLLPASIIDRRKDGFTIPLHEVLNAKEAMQQRDLIIGMDDELHLYSQGFRDRIGKGEVTGKELWPHFALAKWWALHVD